MLLTVKDFHPASDFFSLGVYKFGRIDYNGLRVKYQT